MSNNIWGNIVENKQALSWMIVIVILLVIIITILIDGRIFSEVWLKQIIAAYFFWNLAWIYNHVALGKVKKKWADGVFGFATTTFVCMVTNSNSAILPLYFGFTIASIVMLVRKWDTLDRFLLGSTFYPAQVLGFLCFLPIIKWNVDKPA